MPFYIIERLSRPRLCVRVARPPQGGFCFIGNTVKTRIYIDGFNLYYGILRFRYSPEDPRGTLGRPKYRWLNIARMCGLLLPEHQILGYKYFTALVRPRPEDVEKRVRQRVFIRALETIPDFEIIRGRFQTHPVMMRLTNPPSGGPAFVEVFKTEEKGSDVNLAAHLVNDAHLDKFDVGVIVSNDSDLAEAIRIVTTQLHKEIGIINPQKRPSETLHAHATFHKRIREGVLAASQFPDTMTDHRGSFHKPECW